MTNCSIIITTTTDEAVAHHIAKHLVSKQLAKCVQIERIQSIYMWEGKLVEEGEYRLQIKVADILAAQVMEQIKALHNYQLPEIIQLAINNGNKEYLQWLSSNSN